MVAVLAFLAFAPALTGEFLGLDDERFVGNNPAVKDLSVEKALACFTDPSTLTPEGWEGTYRPLRTLDFAIDWAVGGGRPFLFHLRNALYHVLASLLVLAVLGQLLAERRDAALFGALVFAVHPVQSECVAWITSRGDLLLGCTFLAALLCHLKGRFVAAALFLAAALLSKESAVVFPVAAALTDLVRRERPRWIPWAVYAALAAGYFLLWRSIMPHAGHSSEWWGGSYGANLLTMCRAALFYASALLLPIRQLFDYIVPLRTGLDVGAVLGIVLLALLLGGSLLAALRGRRRAFFVVAWVAVTMLPTSNLLVTVGIPATERFLYLPAVGLSLWAGCLLARTRLRYVVLACLLALSFLRSFDWRSDDALFTAALRVADTPLTLTHATGSALDRAHAAKREGDEEGMRREADAVIRHADDYFALTSELFGRPPPREEGSILWRKADAHLLLGKREQALTLAREAIEKAGGPFADIVAGEALVELDRLKEALPHADRVEPYLSHEPGLRPALAQLLNRIARKLAARGEMGEARKQYIRSWRVFPHRDGNRMAFDVYRTLER